jgi:hypothetical protein
MVSLRQDYLSKRRLPVVWVKHRQLLLILPLLQLLLLL